MSPPRLYGVGVGPGDPELLTLKALRVVRECPVVAVPVSVGKGRQPGAGEEGEGTIALEIMRKALGGMDDKEVLMLDFPMTRDSVLLRRARAKAAETVVRRLEEGLDVAFLTLGDPTLYSTFTNLAPIVSALSGGVELSLVPGVTSVSASAACAGLTLVQAGEKVLVAPAFYDLGDLSRWVKDFDTVVLMKVKSRIAEIKRLLVMCEEGATMGERPSTLRATFVEKAGWPGREFVVNMEELDETYRPSYLSMVIIRKSRGGRDERAGME